jgi:hypothetical protein
LRRPLRIYWNAKHQSDLFQHFSGRASFASSCALQRPQRPGVLKFFRRIKNHFQCFYGYLLNVFSLSGGNSCDSLFKAAGMVIVTLIVFTS